MSNYPPGVTGNEYPIVGGISTTESVVCPGDTDYVPVAQLVEMVRDATRYAGVYANDVQRYVDEIGTIQAECNYEGEAEVEWHHGVGRWTCPRCGTDNEIEDDGTDPDLQREIQREGF